MGKCEYLLESKGFCLLCLKQLRPADEPERIVVPRLHSFRNICKYLKISLRDVLGDIIPLTSSSSQVSEQSELKGMLCEECGSLWNLFSKHFLELEVAKMKVKDSLMSIHDRIVEADRNDGQRGGLQKFKNEMIQESDTIQMYGIVGRFRKATLEKCSILTASGRPHVVINRVAEIPFAAVPLTAPSVQIKSVPVPLSKLPKPSSSSGLGLSTQPYQCDLCPKTFSKRESVWRHKRIHHDGIKYRCDYCPRVFARKYTKLRHMSTVCPGRQSLINHKVQQSEMIMLTGITDAPFQNENDEENLYADILSSSNINSGSHFVPPKTKDATKLVTPKKPQKKLPKHPRVRWKKGMKYECILCGKDFTREDIYQRHHKQVHMGERIKCPDCNKSFQQKDYLERHRLTVHLGHRYQCKLCSKPFSNYNAMHNHMRSWCPVKKSRVSKARKSHSKNPSRIIIPIVQSTETYDSRAIVKSELEQDDDRTTEDRLLPGVDVDVTPEEYKLFMGDEKATVPEVKGNLQGPTSIKTTIAFRCKFCQKNYDSSKNLCLHIMNVHGQQFKCDFCHKNFSRAFSRDRHIKYYCKKPEVAASTSN